ncbi:MAG: GntR family transcriptional regulator [Acidobacteriaceae bacterium]|nr:GntR family transcriptional regulator [Acidobacteriaceae bacterium]
MAAGSQRKEPAYQRIERSIREGIQAGTLKPGETVGSERELARIHGVSPMTARAALAALERKGVVERRRGAGTFVAIPRVDYNQLVSTTELMSSRGFSVRSRLLSSRQVKDQPEIAAKLGLRSESVLVRIERLRLVEGEPLALETSYLPSEKFSDLAGTTLDGGSLFLTVEKRFGSEIAFADEDVDATAADGRVARMLGVAEGTPILRITQVIYSTLGQPLLYVLGLYRSDRHKVHHRRQRR